MIGRFLIILIKAYQNLISPILGTNCRFQPTCSTYTIEAIKKYGALQGTILGFKRIIKCRPGGECGYDPVPEKLR